MMDAIPQELNPFFEKPAPVKRTSWVVDVLQSLVVAVFVFIIIYIFIAIPNQVSGPSMQPNFQDGELLLTNKITQWLGNTQIGQSLGLEYKRGDVVVFQKPERSNLIKRVVGVPGDEIMILRGDVYLNGDRIVEDYIPAEVRTSPGTYAREGETVYLKADEYFLMGDNRNNSQDSRYTEYGPVKRAWLKGRVVLRYWPPQHFGIINTGTFTVAE